MEPLPLTTPSKRKRPLGKKPEWLRMGHPNHELVNRTAHLLKDLELVTVCAEAQCPNLGTCWGRGTATFMIMGDVCTRHCTFCAVRKGKPRDLDPDEPRRVAEASARLELKHVVVTSVTRDDLPDGGASHFAATIHAIRKLLPTATIEVLIPDFQGNRAALQTVIDAHPEIINHNLETIEPLYPKVRPEANYEQSLELLRRVKEADSSIYTKSGIMVGLGETIEQVEELMEDLRAVDCDILTIGQYLKPPNRNLRIEEYVHPKTFLHYRKRGEEMGFKYVASAPLVRSSFNADEFAKFYINQKTV